MTYFKGNSKPKEGWVGKNFHHWSHLGVVLQTNASHLSLGLGVFYRLVRKATSSQGSWEKMPDVVCESQHIRLQTKQTQLHILHGCPVRKQLFLLFLKPCHTACRILVPWLEMEPRSPALGAWSLNHWTTREVQVFLLFIKTEKNQHWHMHTHVYICVYTHAHTLFLPYIIHIRILY